MQSSNEIEFRDKASLILAEIKKAKSVLLHCHPAPDPDSVCSALAMKFALEQLGIKATVIKGDSVISQGFADFPGVGEILPKNFFEINIADFDLFIILDSGSPQMISRLKPIEFPLSIKTIVIDHHASNQSYADINLIDLTSPAVAFVLFKLFKEWGIELTHDIALNLFIGIYTDTGGLRYPPTDHRVYQAVTELVGKAPAFYKAMFTMDNSNTKELLYFQAIALNSIETYLGENIVIASVSQQALTDKKILVKEISNSGISNTLISVIGWNVGILMVEVEEKRVKMSIRSRDEVKFDVSKLAVALGGGGHRAAAGAVLNMSLDEARALVVAKAKELYNL